jgi:hypothetical protein
MRPGPGGGGAPPRGGGGPPGGAPPAAPTRSGVVASGAGVMPAVIRPTTKPGLTRSTRTPLPCSESASPRAKASRPALAAP